MTKKISFRICLALLVSPLLLVFSACLGLRNQVGDLPDRDENFASENDFLIALLPVYDQLKNVGWDIFNVAEITTDEVIVPQRGNDWYDGGQFHRLFQHQWQPEDPHMDPLWWSNFTGVARANRVLNEINAFPGNFPKKALVTAELRCLRAYFNFRLLDFFGNVPLLLDDDFDPANLPPQKTRAEMFQAIETDLAAAMPNLPEAPDYGRFTRHVAHALLAKLYLNAEIYTGAPRYQDALTLCQTITNSGEYSLSSHYADNFSPENHLSGEGEIMLPAIFDPQVPIGFGMNLHMRTLHYAQQQQFNLSQQPWNGFCTTAEFYQSFEATDARRAHFLAGPQLDANGDPIVDANTNQPVVFTPGVDLLNADRDDGIRVLKYTLDPNMPTQDGQNDFPLLRYADVLLMQSEAQMRLGQTAEALAGVNMVRARAGIAALPTLTLDALLAERGRELFWEGWRRNDLIRFGKFCLPRTNKPADDNCAKRQLMPIPANQLRVWPTLQQNPGY